MVTSHEILLGIIPAEAVSTFKSGCNRAVVGGVDVLVHCEGDCIAVYENRCQHQGGRFVRDIEDGHLATCTRHGWKLDGRSGEYINPPPQQGVACFTQTRYRTAFARNGGLEVYKHGILQEGDVKVDFRGGVLTSSKQRCQLTKGELTITYYGHACVIVKCGDFQLATDPWLVGDCFIGGWYPLHKPPMYWAEDLARVNMIYISHRHPDHYHPETLRRVSKLNPTIPIFVAQLSNGSVIDSYLPFDNVIRQKLGTWYRINEDLRIAILEDGALGDLDTSLLMEYRGHTIFNYVDCGNPNFGQLGHFDIVLGDFAAGASGFPMCMRGGKYTDAYVRTKKVQMNSTYMQKTIDIIYATKPKIFIPFAGYFCEQRPEDVRIRKLNIKNTTKDVVQKIYERFGDEIGVYVPVPGVSLDVSEPCPQVVYPEPKHFAQYSRRSISRMLQKYSRAVKTFAPFKSHRDAAFEFYFRWAGFHSYDLVLEIQECDDDFKPNAGVFYVDFRNGLEFPPRIDLNVAPIEKLFVRKDAFRYCLRFACGWDSFFIGFSTRIEREPDVYHYKLWNHMSNKLPQRPPDWNRFMKEVTGAQIQPKFHTKCPQLVWTAFLALLALIVRFILG